MGVKQSIKRPWKLIEINTIAGALSLLAITLAGPAQADPIEAKATAQVLCQFGAQNCVGENVIVSTGDSGIDEWKVGADANVSYQYTGTPGAGSAYAYADLERGLLRARAGRTDPGTTSLAIAELNEVLRFFGSGDVSFWLRVDGDIFPELSGTSGFNQAVFGIRIFETTLTQDFQTNSLSYFGQITRDGFTPIGQSNSGFADVTSFNSNGIEGTLSIRSDRFYFFEFDLITRNNADYSHTAVFSFPDLPADMSFTSGSGVFLSKPAVTPVPEPLTWSLLIAGFGLTGSVLRRRRASMLTSYGRIA